MEVDMRGRNVLITMPVMLLTTIDSAFAATTARVYNSGILVLVFIGFVALVVVVQMIPAILTLMGMLRGLARGKRSQAAEARMVK
jgi:hypothetical protein